MASKAVKHDIEEEDDGFVNGAVFVYEKKSKRKAGVNGKGIPRGKGSGSKGRGERTEFDFRVPI